MLTTGNVVNSGLVVLLCPSNLVKYLITYLSLSIGFSKPWLVEHGAFELVSKHNLVVWYILSLGVNLRVLLFAPILQAVSLPSIEGIFRNARWLEREVSEMGDLWYAGKRDRRALFLVALLYWGVLRKTFPASGFVELRLLPSASQVVAFHVNWQDV